MPRGIQWLTLRAVYEHAKRTGSGLDEQTLDDIGEQVSLRQFDISDRDSNRLSGIVIVTPVSIAVVQRDDLLSAVRIGQDVFGLRSNDNTGATPSACDYRAQQRGVSGGVVRVREVHGAAGVEGGEPGTTVRRSTRDWTTDGADRAHTLTASADLLKLWPKTDLRFAYDFSRAESVYVYGLAANTTLPPVAQLPPVLNTRYRISIDGRYALTRHLAAGLVYWYEKYDVDDFAFSPATLNTVAQPAFLSLG